MTAEHSIGHQVFLILMIYVLFNVIAIRGEQDCVWPMGNSVLGGEQLICNSHISAYTQGVNKKQKVSILVVD